MTLAYEVEAELLWKSNVPELLKQMMSAFEEVNRAVSDLKDNLGELASGSKGIAAFARTMEKLRVPQSALDDLRGLRDATNGLGDLGDEARGLGALNRQLGKLEVPTGALDGLRDLQTATSGLADAQRGMADSAQATARAWKEIEEAARRTRIPPGDGNPAPGLGRRSHGRNHVTAMDGVMGAQMAGDAGTGFFERGFHAYADLQKQQIEAQSDRLVTDAVMQRVNALIANLQKSYPNLTAAEGVTIFRNTSGIFPDPEEALKAMPGAVRLQMLYELAPLGKGGTGGSEAQAAEKAGDAMQEFVDSKGKLDVGLYNKWMDFQARSYEAGGGLVDAKNWLAFARTSRSAGIGLNERAMEEAQALLEMSPGRTGTALMSAFQVFGATTKHMTDKNFDAWKKQGLIGKGGNIIDQQLYQSDPFEWVWKDMVPRLKAHGIQTRDQILRWLTENGQRSTVAGMLADIAIGQTPITRTADKLERQDSNLVDKLEASDAGRLAALNAAENNFFVAVGKFAEGPGIQLLTSLTTALNTLTDEMNAHPETAKNLLLFGGGLALVSKVMGDAGMAYLFIGSPLIAGVQALGGALPGMAAGIAKLLAATGTKVAPAVTADNPWGVAETGIGAALRWGGRLAGALGLGVLGWEAGKSVATSPDWQKLGDHMDNAVHDGLARRAPAQPATLTAPWHTLADAQKAWAPLNAEHDQNPRKSWETGISEHDAYLHPTINMPPIKIPLPPPVHVPPISVPAVHVPPVNVPPITLHAQTLVQIDGKNIPAKSTTTVQDALGAPLTNGGNYDTAFSHQPPVH